MSLQRISENAAFAQGASLWVVPNPEASNWTRKIDWYLNFQMSKAAAKTAPIVEPGLLEILRAENLAAPSTGITAETPLMLSSGHRLPAAQTVEIPFTGDLKSWLTATVKVWHDLGRPPLRVFLPHNISPQQAQELWSDSDESSHVSVVGDIESLHQQRS